MLNKILVDNLGWVDDFRVLPGECGQPISRKIYAYALMKQGVSAKKLKEMGFSKDLVLETFNLIAKEIYDD